MLTAASPANSFLSPNPRSTSRTSPQDVHSRQSTCGNPSISGRFARRHRLARRRHLGQIGFELRPVELGMMPPLFYGVACTPSSKVKSIGQRHGEQESHTGERRDVSCKCRPRYRRRRHRRYVRCAIRKRSPTTSEFRNPKRQLRDMSLPIAEDLPLHGHLQRTSSFARQLLIRRLDGGNSVDCELVPLRGSGDGDRNDALILAGFIDRNQSGIGPNGYRLVADKFLETSEQCTN